MIFSEKINNSECVAVIGSLSLVPIILTMPNISSKEFGTASFFHIVYASLIASLLFLIIFLLFKKLKNKDFLEISKKLGGKPLTIFNGILFSIYFLLQSSLTLSEFNENIRNILFDKSPYLYISLVFMIAILITCLIGIKGIFRASAIIYPFIFLGIIAMLLSLFKDVEVTNFTPIFGNGIQSLFVEGAYKISSYEWLSLLYFLVPCISNPKKTATTSYILIAISLLTTYFLIFGIFSYPTILDNYMPFYELTKILSYGRFIQRVESIFVLFWIFATLIYISTTISFSTKIIKNIFKIKKEKAITFILCIIVLSINLLLSSYIDILALRRILASYITPLFIISYPMLIMTLALLKKNSKETNYETK